MRLSHAPIAFQRSIVAVALAGLLASVSYVAISPRLREQVREARRGDIGWAYVSIEGDDFVEAVRVVVSALGGKPLIREVEWGRP
jgi:hypothetical protein